MVSDGDEQKLVVAEALLPSPWREKVGRELPVERVAARRRPSSGRSYTAARSTGLPDRHPGLWRVVAGDFVELDAGTGVVHAAPAFGEVDFELLRSEQKDDPSLPLLCAVRPDGSFDPEVSEPAYAGRWVKEADRDLTRALRERGLLWHTEQMRHEYPFCVRSDDDPLIQYARPAWYIRTTAHVEECLANNASIQWLPEHIRDGRFGDFLRNNVDWALSRERFWGTPLNIWVNDETGRMEAPASVEEILERATPRPSPPSTGPARRIPPSRLTCVVHKPWIDDVTWTREGEPGVYRRVPEVIDAWFDSGSMPFAQWGYPHRGVEEFDKSFPADFISEAIDQTRGWFNSLLWISTLLFPDEPGPPSLQELHRARPRGRPGGEEGVEEQGELHAARGDPRPGSPRVRGGRPERRASAPGTASIAREDYEGLDLSAAKRRACVCIAKIGRGDVLDVDLRPVAMPRRVIQLAAGGRRPPRRHARREPTHTSCRGRCRAFRDRNGRSGSKIRARRRPGADAFRWFFYSQNPPWNPTRHSLSAVRAAQRELPLKLRNVYAFFTIYAEIDGFDPASHWRVSPEGVCRRRARAHRPLDRVSELALATRAGARAHGRLPRLRGDGRADSPIWSTPCRTGTCAATRDRFWEAGLGPDKLDAHWTLYECLTTLARLLAPFLPFAAEELWQNLVARPFGGSQPESVHLSDYPEPDAAASDAALSTEMAAVREIVSLGLQVRTAQRLRVRQPLSAVEIVLADAALADRVLAHEGLILDELNVHALHLVEEADAYVAYQVKPNFRALGPKVGKRMPKLKAALADADGAALLRELESDGRVVLEVEGEEIALGPEDIAVSLEAREGFAAAAGVAGVVVLHTNLTDALVEEGLFREVLNRVQSFRKELDLEYTGRIRLTLAGADRLLDAVRPRVEELGRETLAVQVRVGVPPAEGAHVHEATIEGDPLRLGLELA